MLMWTRSKGTSFRHYQFIAHNRDRRLVQCYLEICDLERCKVHVSRLVKSKIADPFNHYLAYCLALKTKDAEGGPSSRVGFLSNC